MHTDQNLSVHMVTEVVCQCRFKLHLAEDFVRATPLPPTLSPQRLMSDLLRFLKQMALKSLHEQWGSARVSIHDIAWAITVPANWSDAAKQTMRNAAVEAGMVSSPASRYANTTLKLPLSKHHAYARASCCTLCTCSSATRSNVPYVSAHARIEPNTCCSY